MRIEKDFIGQLEIEDKLYGINTVRALDNFKLNNKPTNYKLIDGIVLIKKAAARSYISLGVDIEKYKAILKACDLILAGEYYDSFVTEALQGGAGTSTNMNVNEVIANLALLSIGKNKGDYSYINPLDDVNRGQSTNDVYPTALRVAIIKELRLLSEECASLQEAFQEKESQYYSIKKLGRTELMDAVPISFGEIFGAYGQCISRDRWRIYKVEERLRQINLGGTAIGTSLGCDKKFRFKIIEELRNITDMGLALAEYPIDITQNNDVFVEVSGMIKANATNLLKIANDLRLMNSGPVGGIGEISLMPLQQGSSIMPGKVNPVIPEMIMQVGIKVMANDYAITMAAAHGEFELNAFLPLIANSILESLELLCNGIKIFREKCIVPMIINRDRCEELLSKSKAFTVDYINILGYKKVEKVINMHSNDNEKIKELLDELVKAL